MNKSNSIPFYYAGIIILTALVIGGGTTQGLWTDHLVQIMLIPALFVGLSNLHKSRLSPAALITLLFIVFIFTLQFFPIVREIKINNTQTTLQSSLFSFSPQKSLETVLFASSVLGFSVFISRFNDVDLARLIRFFLVGLTVNLILAALQLSYSGATRIDGFLPFTITSATFANGNHFSTLAFASIPLVAFHYLVRVRRPVIFLFITAIISIILFAIGSRAGMAITLSVSSVCFIWFILNKKSSAQKIMYIATLSMCAMIVAYLIIDTPDSTEFIRDNFAINTLLAIKDNYLFGTGLGSFIEIYPSYEPLHETNHLYVNHAHNDILEILLETGILGAAAFALFSTRLILGMKRSKLSQSAAIGVIAIAGHSLLDYPLRTMAVAILFAFFITILLCENDEKEKNTLR